MRRPPPKGSEKNRQFGPRRIRGQFVDVPEIALYLGLTLKATRARIARGEIPARRFGRRVVALRGELDAWMQKLPRVTEVVTK